MKHLVLAVCLFSVLITACQASDSNNTNTAAPSAAQTVQEKQALREEIYERAKKRNGGKEPTKLELLNELMGKAQEHVGAVKDYGKPRVVARGAKPEIVIKGSKFYIDGTDLRIGDSLALWKAILGGGERCQMGDLVFACIWDQLGIQVEAPRNTPNRTSGIEISLNLEPPDPLFPRPRPPWFPKQAFPGYLELDGYGIDAQTKFWEIRASADPKRNLRCNPRDCSHPHGRFADTGNIYLRLNSTSEYGNVYELSIGTGSH